MVRLSQPKIDNTNLIVRRRWEKGSKIHTLALKTGTDLAENCTNKSEGFTVSTVCQKLTICAHSLAKKVRLARVNEHAVLRTRRLENVWESRNFILVDALVQGFIISVEDTIMSDRRCQSKEAFQVIICQLGALVSYIRKSLVACSIMVNIIYRHMQFLSAIFGLIKFGI